MLAQVKYLSNLIVIIITFIKIQLSVCMSVLKCSFVKEIFKSKSNAAFTIYAT